MNNVISNINIYKDIEQKISFLKDIIKESFSAMQNYKTMDVISGNEINTTINSFDKLFANLNELNKKLMGDINIDCENIYNEIKQIKSKLLSIFSNSGTKYFEKLIILLLDNNNIENIDRDKYSLLCNYAHPIGFKILDWKNYHPSTNKNKKYIQKNKIIDDKMIIEHANNLECLDLSRTNKTFQIQVYGIKVIIHNAKKRETYIISCLVDDILLSCVDNYFILDKYSKLDSEKPKDNEYKNEDWENFKKFLTLKDFLILNNNEIYRKYISILTQNNFYKQKNISQIVNEFLNSDLYVQRNILINLLVKSNDNEYQYMSYLLYDLLSNDNQSSIDTIEQTMLYDSLPWHCKVYFKNAMKQTISYTNQLCNYDETKIPLEQQICLMKASNNIKEKAMVKLKEIKAKSEDTGSKARHYLDGLLKIPFGIYKEEYILSVKKELNSQFTFLLELPIIKNIEKFEINKKNIYTIIEIKNIIKNITENIVPEILNNIKNDYIINVKKLKKPDIVKINTNINNFISNNNYNHDNVAIANKKIDFLLNNVNNFINSLKEKDDLLNYLKILPEYENEYNNIKLLEKNILEITNKIDTISQYMKDVKANLDSSVYGHDNAKEQIETIIAQWINGEKSGYCFGFEGPPGVGKCLAKDTPIMLSNGEIKMVQNITLEDKLMGDDSTPRNVLALGTGIEKMYKIEQIKGDDYIVNESHILSLKMTKAGKKGDKHQMILGRRYFKNDIVDISIKDYLSLPLYLKECLKGYKVALDFEEKEVDLEPYALGYWLGDGDSSTLRITTIEKPIVDYFKEYAFNNGLQITQGKNEKSMITYHITTGYTGGRSDKNKLLNYLKNHNLINNKHIPEIYKCNSRENRLKLLAGLIDSDGYYNNVNNSLQITEKNKKLADDILFLVRSLGFRGTMKECSKSCIYKGEKKTGQYQRIIITGSGREEIPVLLERKQVKEHKQIKDGLNTGIKIVPLEEDKYYGFQIDGNSRFLLGDFTVTHNTSLAKKGISKCLQDYDGKSRPFSFIAIGGSSNGSTLEGHNYTYVGSTWGKIVDVLMENKCMNPIIFIDELDKISKTEHGREIIGILTHLIDYTQNDSFQDKYFNGVDLDLSKVLFIFSYNDVDAIDKILLDRIHRIKFKHLSLEEKITITKNFILPELYTKVGFENVLSFDDDVLINIINNFTLEPGVRKLKEILFEIIGKINLKLLNNDFDENTSFPINITYEMIKNDYLKNRHELNIKNIISEPDFGIINGLWANSLGQGGLLYIEVKKIISSTLLELKLTGMQGDVMKESMNVAKTVAIEKYMNSCKIDKIVEEYKNIGLHIHVPEGATPKDGPSAGAAITTAIYSVLMKKKINNLFALTGEISLQGFVTEIGGLDLKILGGIKSGAKKFIYPKCNTKDFNEFYEKYKEKEILKDIEFYSVEKIDEVFKLILID
jgi:hypothetical protein